MGIASLLLGEDNPFTQWTSQNQNLLNAIGSGLGQGQNIQSGLTAGLAQVPQAKQLDQQAAEKTKASKLAEQQLNATKNWLQNNHPDLAQMVDAGMPVSEAWQAAMQRMQPQGGQGLINAGGGSIYDPNSGKWIHDPNAAAAGGGGPYQGTSMDGQNWNMLLTGDPSTPEYAAAWSQLTAPKMTLKETAEGVVPVYETPEIPASIRRPTGSMPAAAPPAAPAQAPNQPAWGAAPPSFGGGMQPALAVPSGPAVGAALPGTKARPTEAQMRNASIGEVLASEVPKVGNNFKALTDPKGQLLSVLGDVGNPWQSAGYQQAAAGLKSAISQVLYSLSGATANPGEVTNQIDVLTPKFGDKPEVIADKLDRFKVLVRSVAKASGDPEVKKMVEDAIASLGLEAGADNDPLGIR